MNSTPLKMSPQADSSVTVSPTTQPSLQLMTRRERKGPARSTGAWLAGGG